MGKFDDIDEFLDRPWRASSIRKHQHWQTQSASARLDAATQLYVHARETNPDWPTADDRRRDLEHHIKMANLFASIDECTERNRFQLSESSLTRMSHP